MKKLMIMIVIVHKNNLIQILKFNFRISNDKMLNIKIMTLFNNLYLLIIVFLLKIMNFYHLRVKKINL